MQYQPISVREAVENINKKWFLPAIQRPYDWGERSKKKEFIYKLFDSLLRRYPIGGMIIWQTRKKIPYRDFLGDYDSESLARVKDKGVWGKPDKFLIYDGQQRLQSLYSCLKYTFHNEVLCYDVLFDPRQDDSSKGFRFVRRNDGQDAPSLVRLNQLYECDPDERGDFEEGVLKGIKGPSKEQRSLVRRNLANLWGILVEKDIKLLALFPLDESMSQDEVLNVFKRINTTGMQLTKSEILFSDIKRIQYDFEENIWDACSRIKKGTGGFSVTPDFVLQVIHMLVKGTIRVDPERLERDDKSRFVAVWRDLESPLSSFFSDFLYKEFRINHASIINLQDPLIPLIGYFYYMRTIHGHRYRDFTSKSIRHMKRYLIKSQLLYWDYQVYYDEFHGIVKEAVENGNSLTFPYAKITAFVKEDKRRFYTLKSDYFDDDPGNRWFTLKILTPEREFHYAGNREERFDPEIDHIFPLNPRDDVSAPRNYGQFAKTMWNLQPMKGDLNAHKLNNPPSEFLKKYPQYLASYDFVPKRGLKSSLWKERNIRRFVELRKRKMIAFARKEYGLQIKN